MTEKDAYIETMELLKKYEAMYPPIYSKEDKEKIIEEIRDVMYPFTDYYKDGAKEEFYAALAVAIRSKLVKFESRIHIDFLRTYIHESYIIYKHNKNMAKKEDDEDSPESTVHQMLKGLMRGN